MVALAKYLFLSVSALVAGYGSCQFGYPSPIRLSKPRASILPKIVQDKITDVKFSLPSELRRLLNYSGRTQSTVEERQKWSEGEDHLVEAKSHLTTVRSRAERKVVKDYEIYNRPVPLQLMEIGASNASQSGKIGLKPASNASQSGQIGLKTVSNASQSGQIGLNTASNASQSGNHGLKTASNASQSGHHGLKTSTKNPQAISRTSSPCLTYLFCHHDARGIDFQQLEIHFWDFPERSAAACGHLCFQVRPSSRLVFAKMVDMNERLVCGCANKSAIVGDRGVLSDSDCSQCPDGERTCGGIVSVSVYSLAETCSITPTTAPTTTTTSPGSLSYTGCFRAEEVEEQDHINNIVYLSRPNRSMASCADHCRDQAPQTDLVLLSYRQTEDQLYCACGSRGAFLTSATALDDSQCQLSCPDGGGTCGGVGNAVSVYSSGRGVKPSPLLHLLLLFLSLLSARAVSDSVGLSR